MPSLRPFVSQAHLGLLAVTVLCAACAGSVRATTPAPAWYPRPPESASLLRFAGHASGAADERVARELAYQAALAELSVSLGAKIRTDFSGLSAEKDGTGTQEVALMVTVSGVARTLRGIRTEAIECRRRDDGFEAYALISWPKAERQALESSERSQAQLAVARYQAAESAHTARDFDRAEQELAEARNLLGSVVGPVVIEHREFQDSASLRAALDSLASRIAADRVGQAKVCAVGLRCTKDGAPVPCRTSRIGVVRGAVARAGLQLAAEGVPDALLTALLEARAIPAEEARKRAGCLVAVDLGAELLEEGKPFTFVRTGARTVLYDSALGKVSWSDEIPPSKVGHVSYDGAMNKGFDGLEKTVAVRLAAALRGR